jgi:magnesium transporter
MVRTRLYRDGVLETENFPIGEVSARLRDPAAVVWVDLCAPGEPDLAALGSELGLHQVAVAAAAHDRHQRARLDRYDGHSYLTAYAVRLDPRTGVLAAHEVSAFVADRALVTIRQSDAVDIGDVVARWDGAPELAGTGVGFLLHGLLDSIVDGQFDAVQTLDEQVDALEDLLFADRVDQGDLQRRSLRLRRSLTELRHVVLPMRDVLTALIRRDAHAVDDALLPYFQDVYNHVLRVTEWTESLRELVATVRETQLSLQANRLNAIMKKVTSWAAIIAVPTAITGFYGQNVPYPGIDQPWGFWLSTAAILAVSATLYLLFKRRDWL